jgi:hypothetical protein
MSMVGGQGMRDADGKKQYCGCKKGTCRTKQCVCFVGQRHAVMGDTIQNGKTMTRMGGNYLLFGFSYCNHYYIKPTDVLDSVSVILLREYLR